MRYEIICCDNLEYLRTMADNSIDSVVTDGPYGLGKEPDAAKCLTAWVLNGYYETGGKGFMGKTWDAFVPQPIFWKEVFRVLKPGGHVLSFAGSRTYDWMVMAMRLAGFEIRDQLMWIYGGGFPKSLDVSKAMDKKAGVVREVVGRHNSPAANKAGGSSYNMSVLGMPPDVDITEPATDEAKQWQGYGTALSPSHEPIVMARKPLEGTVVENVLKWGCGGLNIDGCRVGTDGGTTTIAGSEKSKTVNSLGDGLGAQGGVILDSGSGRWPSNLIHDGSDDVEGLFPETGVNGIASGPTHGKMGTQGILGTAKGEGIEAVFHADSGSASRYFYCAKPSNYERSLGVAKGVAGSYEFRQDGSLDGKPTASRGNFHPTVKPVALMQHLVRLVTPPNGVCLDPFFGSGTTGLGAMLAGDGIRIIGLEMTAEYIPIATDRLKHWRKYRQFTEPKKTDAKARKSSSEAAKQGKLF